MYRVSPHMTGGPDVVGQSLGASVAAVRNLHGLSLPCRLGLGGCKLAAVAGYHLGKRASANSAIMVKTRPSRPAIIERKVAKVAPASGRAQKVAIVIPLYTKPDESLSTLEQTVENLLMSTQIPKQIILVDDGSPNPIPLNFGNEKVTILRLGTNCGPAAARNAGLREAKSCGAEIVLFTDSDCKPTINWVEQMMEAQKQAPGIITGCSVSSADSQDSLVGLYHDVFGTLNGRSLPDGSILYGCTCNLSIKLDEVALEFDESFPLAAFEDIELCIRARKQGIQLNYEPAAIVEHVYDTSLQGLFRQFQKYGRMEDHMIEKHQDYPQMLKDSHDISVKPETNPDHRLG